MFTRKAFEYADNLTLNKGEVLEVEARLGTFKSNFVPNVGKKNFNHLLNLLKSNSDLKSLPVIKSRDEIYNSGVRVTHQNKKITIIEKTQKKNFDNKDYGVRVTVSVETPATKPKANEKIVTVRNKTRHIFRAASKTEIHLTQVKQEKQTSYEVEIEFNDKSSSEKADVFIENLFCFLYNTDEIYTTKEKKSIINLINIFIGGNQNEKIDHRKLPNARNLKFDDMVNEGLYRRDLSYFVSLKADGINRFIVLLKSGIFIVSSFSEINKIFAGKQKIKDVVIQGELIPKENRLKYKEYQYVVYAFDYLNNSDEIYRDRIEKMKNIVGKIKSIPEVFKIKPKDVYEFNKIDEMFSYNNYLLNETDLEFKIDGLVFTPNMKYDTHTDIPFLDRKLTLAPEIVKWKFQDMLTIDFVVRHNKLFVTQRGRGLVEFRGTDKYPLRKIEIDRNDVNFKDGDIVEMSYGDKIWIAHRVRDDKIVPNLDTTAINVWGDIMDPITEETIIGLGDKLFDKYLIRHKTQIIGDAKVLLILGKDQINLDSYENAPFTYQVVHDEEIQKGRTHINSNVWEYQKIIQYFRDNNIWPDVILMDTSSNSVDFTDEEQIAGFLQLILYLTQRKSTFYFIDVDVKKAEKIASNIYEEKKQFKKKETEEKSGSESEEEEENIYIISSGVVFGNKEVALCDVKIVHKNFNTNAKRIRNISKVTHLPNESLNSIGNTYKNMFSTFYIEPNM